MEISSWLSSSIKTMMKHIRIRVNGPKLKAMISETVRNKKMPDVAQVVFCFLAQHSFQKDQISKDWIAHILISHHTILRLNLCSHLFF